MPAEYLVEVEAITFDAGGTLIVPHPSVGAVYAEVLTQYGITVQPPALDHAFTLAFKAARRKPRPVINEETEKAFWRDVVSYTVRPFLKSDSTTFSQAFDDLYETFGSAKRWRCQPGARETLESLRERGYRLGLLSNSDKRFRQVFAELGMDGLFEHFILSSEVGFEKPDPRLFESVEAAFGLAPGQFLHVGDSCFHDGDGPLLAGWQTVLYAPGDQPPGYAAVAALGDLLDLLPGAAV